MVKLPRIKQILALIFSCLMTVNAQNQNPKEKTPENLLITLDVSSQYRPNPKMHVTVTVESDGTVSFNVLLPVERQALKTIKLTPNQLEDLLMESKKSEFFALDDNYSLEDGNCDGPALSHHIDKILSIRFNTKTKKVQSVAGCVGKDGSGLERFDLLTDKIVGLQKLIK